MGRPAYIKSRPGIGILKFFDSRGLFPPGGTSGFRISLISGDIRYPECIGIKNEQDYRRLFDVTNAQAFIGIERNLYFS